MRISPDRHSGVVSSNLAELVKADRLLSSSFGPLGLSKLIAASSGSLNTSKRFSELLPCIATTPGAATWVLDLLKDAASQLPDGGQAAMLALTAALQQVQLLSGVQQQDQHARKRMLFCLSDLKEWFLLQALPAAGQAGLLQLPVPGDITDGEPANQVVRAVLHTMFATSTDRCTAEILANLSMELLEHTAEAEGDASGGVNALVQAAQKLQVAPPLVAAPGRSLRTSGLLPGMVLHGAFSSQHMPTSLEGVRFVVLRCPLDPDGPASWQGQVLAEGDAHYRALLNQRLEQLQQRLLAVRGCHPEGVNLVMLSEAVSAECAAMARQLDITLLPLVDTASLQSLCYTVGMQPTWSPDLEALRSCMVAASPCIEPITLSPAQPSLLLHLPSSAATLMLCAPSEPRCQQLSRLIRAGINLLANHASTQDSVSSMSQQEQPLRRVPPVPVVSGAQREGAAKQHTSAAGHADSAPASAGLEVVPGGGSFELLLAAEVEAVLDAVRQVKHMPDVVQRAVERHGAVQVAHALQVLLAAALAAPKTLAASGARGGSGGGRSSAASSHAHSSLHLVTRARDAVRRDPAGRWGLVLPAAAAWDADDGDGVLQREAEWEMALGHPAAYGVVELLDAKVEVWRCMADVLVQVLRVGGVAAAARRPPGSSDLVAARDWSRRRGVRKARHGAGVLDGSDDDGADSSDS